MVILKSLKSGDIHYGFVEELLHSAFPKAERRDDENQRWNTDHDPRFCCLLVMKGTSPIGLLTYWGFDTFIYIEHFAISPHSRGQGVGREVICKFVEEYASKPVVMEVELPEDEWSRRRIAFYKRCGFDLWECDYLQPPYRSGDGWFPLYLMASPGLVFEQDYPHIRETLHQQVYGEE